MIVYNLYAKPKKLSTTVVPCKPENFLRANKNFATAAVIHHFMHNQIYDDKQEEIQIISPKEIERINDKDLDLGSMFLRFVSTDKYIYSIFYKLDVKYTKQFVCYTILAIYNIITELFSRTRLRMITTQPGVYYLVFRSTHNYDTEISLNYAYETYGELDGKKLARRIKKAQDLMEKEATKSDNKNTKEVS